jgi:hypothetical protein
MELTAVLKTDHNRRTWRAVFIQRVGVGFFQVGLSAVGIDEQAITVCAGFHDPIGSATKSKKLAACFVFLGIRYARLSFDVEESDQFGNENEWFSCRAK